MNTKTLSLIISVFALMTSSAAAEWGHGLGKQYKTIVVPMNQQSGWGLKPEPVEATPTAQAASPAATTPVASAPQDTTGAAAAAAAPNDYWGLSEIKFDSDSDKIKPESAEQLDKTAELLKTNSHVIVEIQGHTDSGGEASANEALSQKRAAAVQKYLVEQGVDSDRLTAKGYGESKPIADNSTEDGRAQNRRIEFKVLDQ